MHHDAFWLAASDHCSLYVYQWLPDTPIKAVVLLAHGMAEHAGRYQRLGEALTNAAMPCSPTTSVATDAPPNLAL